MRTKFFLLILLLAFGTVECQAQFVQARGKEIVDPAGQPLLLRGLGLGGWLVPEGYMLHVPGYGSPTSIRTLIEQLLGPADTAEFYRRYQANYVNEQDIRLIASWGCNSIRLPFTYQLLSPKDQPDVFLEEGFQVLDSLITWCKRAGLYVILDLHCAPGGQNSLNISDSDGTARLWTEPANQDRTVAIWRQIAARYANEPWVAGYDLLNEPVMPSGFTNLDLRNLYRRIAVAIREVDANHLLFIEGGNFATDFTDLAPPLFYGSNVAYSFHKYWNETTRPTIQSYLNLRDNWNVPLWMGEAGENSNPWFYETIKLLEENNVGWCWWTHKKIQTTTSPLSAPFAPGYQTVLDYWNGRAGKPSLDLARAALFGMAANLALENCVPRPDVLRALFDREFNSRLKPYASHRLPGKISCAEFDFGNAGLAYQDQDFKKTRWDVDQPWNSGREFRNDGVDLEASKDAQGATYGIGWIADGEWVKYSVTVQQAGIYEVNLRIAGPNGGGLLKLLRNGQELVPATAVPRTSGWYDWATLRVPNVSLPAGEQVLTLFFVRAGFNINQMEFVLKTPAAVQEAPGGALIEDLHLLQNYPNPLRFAGNQAGVAAGGTATTIAFSLPADAQVSLNIYNLSGQEVSTLSRGLLRAGRHTVVWNGRDRSGNAVPAGLYVYALQAETHSLSRKLLVLP
ncbi:cellulase family glycosylhydrolase [bacterium]|nr:cellulase family glycosylhydrolase [bacterium]